MSGFVTMHLCSQTCPARPLEAPKTRERAAFRPSRKTRSIEYARRRRKTRLVRSAEGSVRLVLTLLKSSRQPPLKSSAQS